MKRTTLDLLVCPTCHQALTLQNDSNEVVLTGQLHCQKCLKSFSIQDGMPHFIEYSDLNGYNRRFAGLYNRFSWIYSTFSKVAFSLIGIQEESGRREITDQLDPQGGRILEVSIGPGVNLPYLINRPDVGEVFGLDISLGQLQRCKDFVRKNCWDVELFLGNGEQLPFHDNTFDGILHVGGINFFNDKQAAINEMIRVAKPGARVLIADETEKGARGYEKFIPGFKDSFPGEREAVKSPAHLVPSEMLEMQVSEVWKGWFYCIAFHKP